MKSRSMSFSIKEKKILRDLVYKNKDIIENKRTDAASCESKRSTWKNISKEYNSYKDVVRRDDKQLKRCWEKMKTELKKQKTDEMCCRMGTGGGPPQKFQSDPITAQVETIDPNLDIVIEETFDSDFHHLSATSTHTICASSPVQSPSPIPSHSPSHPSPNLSHTHPFSLSVPITLPSSSTILERRPSFAEPATASTAPFCPSSKKSFQRCKRARTVPTVIEEELKARLGIMEEKRLQQQAEHECKMRHYRRQDEIAAEELQRAVAERKLAEARLQQFLEGDVLTEKDAAPRTEEEKETVNINKRKSRNVTEKTIESEMERSEVSSNVTTPKKMINYNPDVAVGQILLSQVNGFYCHPCRRFFFREDQAFQLHCRTLSHFNNYLVFIKSQVHDVESCNEAEEKDSNKSQLKNRPSVDKSKHSEGEKDANEIKEELLYEDEVAEDAEISGIPVNESEIIDVQNNMPLEKGCPETKEIEYSEEELLGGEDEGAGETEIIIKVESEEAMEAEI